MRRIGFKACEARVEVSRRQNISPIRPNKRQPTSIKRPDQTAATLLDSQNLDPIPCDCDGMFKVGGEFPVFGYKGPLVGKGDNFEGALVNHRLDADGEAALNQFTFPGTAEVGNGGRFFVEVPTDTVAD